MLLLLLLLQRGGGVVVVVVVAVELVDDVIVEEAEFGDEVDGLGADDGGRGEEDGDLGEDVLVEDEVEEEVGGLKEDPGDEGLAVASLLGLGVDDGIDDEAGELDDDVEGGGLEEPRELLDDPVVADAAVGDAVGVAAQGHELHSRGDDDAGDGDVQQGRDAEGHRRDVDFREAREDALDGVDDHDRQPGGELDVDHVLHQVVQGEPQVRRDGKIVADGVKEGLRELVVGGGDVPPRKVRLDVRRHPSNQRRPEAREEVGGGVRAADGALLGVVDDAAGLPGEGPLRLRELELLGHEAVEAPRRRPDRQEQEEEVHQDAGEDGEVDVFEGHLGLLRPLRAPAARLADGRRLKKARLLGDPDEDRYPAEAHQLRIQAVQEALVVVLRRPIVDDRHER
eukprot:CAMPEP_0118908920 /NCGR_PEP_ID=MMETSP1166-20130328/11720_1 /TAXON_ID=1104430 /ORGANISM="Chrysoreinhardia sp, Strain CCMP3193" /LENGTH=395 /DNA_ID=CAMNT_0006848325 /DNA_START=57 /DNA_END=1242 /DNA_ORIENTATION=-